MRSKCSICRLPVQARAVVDVALRENMPLKAISDRTGLAVTTLWRHSRHLVKAEVAETAPRDAPKVKTATPAPPNQAVPAPAVQTPTPEPIDQEAKRQQAESRLERLWNESMAGLEDSKEPVVLTKADGSVVEVRDHRARAAFIRCGESIVDTQAKLAGLYDAPATQNFATAVFERVILLSKLPSAELPMKAEPKVIDATPEPVKPSVSAPAPKAPAPD